MARQMDQNVHKSRYGRTVLVTGASSGIGLAIARLLLKQGFTVLAASRYMTDTYPDLIAREPALNGLIPLKLDMTDEQGCVDLINRINGQYGELAAIFHCAGSGIAGAIEETPPAEARWQMEQLFFGTIQVVRPALAIMRKQGKGLIVLISSVAGSIPIPFQTYYSAGKAAVLAFASGLADEVAPFGIRVTVVSPGDTKTGFTAARRVITTDRSSESPYGERLNRSVDRMARDEQNGMDPATIAQVAVSSLYKKKPPLNQTPGLMYQMIMLLWRILPTRLFRMVIRLVYG